MNLTEKQTEAIEALEDHTTNDLLFGGGAGGGKSAFGCFWQIRRRLQYPGTRGLIGRAVLKTLKETTLVTFFRDCHTTEP
jgi:phage terminase large subunit